MISLYNYLPLLVLNNRLITKTPTFPTQSPSLERCRRFSSDSLFCRLVIRTFRINHSKIRGTTPCPPTHLLPCGLTLARLKARALQARFACNYRAMRFTYEGCYRIVRSISDDVPPHPFSRLLIHQPKIDLHLVRSWLENCECEHEMELDVSELTWAGWLGEVF